MSLYPLSYQNLKRATTFMRRRSRGAEPRLGQSPPHFKTVRAGLRRKPRAHPLRRFHRLAWPGYFTFGIGYFLHGGQVTNDLWSSKVAFDFFPLIWLAISLVFTCRAFFAVDRLPIRICATAMNLAYPFYFAFLVATGA